MENYPRESRDNRNQQGSGRGRSAAPPSTRDRGRGRSGPSQQRGRGNIVSETVDRPMPTAPARAYAIDELKSHLFLVHFSVLFSSEND